MITRWLMVALLGLVASCLNACGDRSRERPTQESETRIVSLSPAASVMLGELGLADALVGRHGFDAIAADSLPVVGDQTGLDYERLIGVRPTHIVIEWGARDPPKRLLELVESRDIELIPFETLAVADIVASGQRLAEAFATQIEAKLLQRFIDRLASLTESQPRVPSAGRVLLVVATSPTVDCLGPGSAHAELLELGGFSSAIDAGGPWMSLSLEDVIALDPDSIVLVQPGGMDDPTLALGPLAGLPITAVELDRVAVITDPASLIPSSNLVAFAATLHDRLLAMGPLPSPRE